MAVKITPSELASALDKFNLSAAEMTSHELAECLLVEAIATRLQQQKGERGEC